MDSILVSAGLVANIPAVLLGEAATRVVPMNYVRLGAALVFAALGAWVLAATAGLV